MSLIVHWLILAIAIGAASRVVPGVHVSSISAALAGAAVLGLLNVLLRPLLLLLTLPVNILTLGLFTFVINAVVIWFAADLVRGFRIDTLFHALLAAIVVSICSTLLHWILNS